MLNDALGVLEQRQRMFLSAMVSFSTTPARAVRCSSVVASRVWSDPGGLDLNGARSSPT